ncbi:MAG: CARDB domain-containing protein [Solirubrobacteraceae bacterium]
MRRFCAGLCALLVGALALPGTVLGSTSPRAALRAFTCQHGMDPAQRSIGVTSVMRPVSGTRHLAVKFDLLVSHGPGTLTRAVRAGDLGVWIAPDNPTLGQLPGDVWNLDKTVVDLNAPAVYRFRVQFRWTGAQHHVLAMTTRYTRRCSLRELRPDLQVRSITVTAEPGNPNRDDYAALIANAGNTAAGPFDVLFAPADGSATTTHTVTTLKAHSSRTMTFVGPVCSSGTAPTITVDSAHQIDDLNRANNALVAQCPAVSSG